MVGDTGLIKEILTPVARTSTMTRNHKQYSGCNSWVDITGYIGKNPEYHSGTN